MPRYRQASPELRDLARSLRSAMTPHEATLWRELRRRYVGGERFKRQCPLGGYILDFCCPKHRVAIEVDGNVHDGREDADALRTEHIETFGYRVLRIRNDAIEADLPAVLTRIAETLQDTP